MEGISPADGCWHLSMIHATFYFEKHVLLGKIKVRGDSEIATAIENLLFVKACLWTILYRSLEFIGINTSLKQAKVWTKGFKI